MADTRTRIINLPEATTLDSSMNFVEDSADGSGTRRVTYDTLKGAINQEGAANLAPAYSNAATYNVGDLCTYQGKLYSCSTAISTAEDWTAAHWTVTNMATDVSQLKSELTADEALYTSGEVKVPFTWVNRTTSSSTGLPTTESSIRISGSLVRIPENCAFEAEKLTIAGARGEVYLFNSSNEFIELKSISDYAINCPVRIRNENAKYARACIYYADNREITPSDADSMWSFKFRFIPDIDNSEYIGKTSQNLIDVSKSVSGYIASADGRLEVSSSYNTTDFIPVNGNSKIIFRKRIRKLLGYDEYKLPIGSTYNNDGYGSGGYVYTVPSGVEYIRVSYFTSDSQIQANYGDTLAPYTAYQTKVEEGVHLSETMLADVVNGNVLNGKKWVACGDSFTQGDFSGSSEEYVFQDGKYAGLYKVYPYIIGLRTGATIVNEAISGSSMAYVNGNIYEFSKENGRYTQIPSDADYITLYFGINDSHHAVPIGTISDADNTTFYGAWNVVMQYLIAHHPNAKIGIIISNGCDSVDYPNAEIAIAKKYGVSYLDFNSDYKVPMLFRVNGKPDVDPSIISANLAHYRVSPTNGHPNVAMHEYESTIIQHWLESM